MDKKVVLMILDGWGIATNPKVSAIDAAKTPFISSLYGKYAHSKLEASGIAVGLPEGQMGNSEVGHMNLGAGRVVYQNLVRINKAVTENTLGQEPELAKAFDYAKANNKSVHFMGLVSDGGVHAHIEHLKSLLSTASEAGLGKVFVHAFTDGRDTNSTANLNEISKLAGEKNIPIFFVGFGLSQPASIELRDFVLPEIVQAGELLGVPVRWKLSKFDLDNNPAAKVELRLTLDGVEVAKDTIPAKPGEDIRHALMFRPPFTGLNKDNSEVKVFAKLTGIANASAEDSLTRPVKIIDRKIKMRHKRNI